MAFFQLVLKARKLEAARLKYENEKLRSIEISRGAEPQYTLGQRIRRKKLLYKRKLKNFCKRVFALPKDSWYYKGIVALRTDGTLENYVAKSFLGFIGGVFLTYIFFVFFVLQLSFKLSSATALCTIMGVILTLGLAFSPRVRCVVFLLLPQFFSKRGRQALMAYAFILALSGPVKNTLHNTGVLSESLACAQEQLKEAVKTVVDLVKQPFYALRDAISKVIRSVKVIVKKIKQTLLAIKRIVLSILRVISSVFQWLGSIINMCNKTLGTPYDRCQNVFDGAVADCKAKLGPILGVVCNLTYVVGTLCYVVKPLDFICMLVSYIADTVVGSVRSKIKKFTMHMKAMFYVKVKFSHSFHFETNQSKTIEEVSTGIVTEVRSRTDRFFGFFNWMSFVTSLFIFIILLRVMRYRYKWLTSERFDNRYITDDLRTIDLIRARQDKETVLPLNPRERNRYVPLSSVILIKSEKMKLARSAIFLSLATIKLFAYMTIDYSLYWTLNIIQLHGRFQSKVDRPNVVTMHVSGDGYLSDLYRSIVKAFTPHGKEAEVDTMVCLPDPVPPDLDKYTQIVGLIIFCWFIAVFEPYGLRLRHVVMCQYYPDRAKQRAAWLYNHIIRSRGSFLKFARRQLRRKFGISNGEEIEKVTLKERLWSMCPLLNKLFPLKQNMCLLCGAVERPDDNPHIKCPTPGCVGLFCTQCFTDLQNICTICRSPVEYGDLSDMSEEKDSSDDQLPRVPRERVEPPVKDEETSEEDELVEEEEERKEEKVKVEEEKKIEKEKETDKVEKEVTKVEKDVAEQTEDKYVGDVDQSSESSYSYTYQDESPKEEEIVKRREPFKDVEAQKIRDDVTIQIFNEPFVMESCWSDESPTSCFVVRARRNVRARLKRKPRSSPARPESTDSSTSIVTGSWSTEEVDEEEIIHVEVDDASEELLSRDRKDQGKRGRINKIVEAVAKIPWLGKIESEKKGGRSLKTKRPSLMHRIVSMLQKKETLPVQTYKRTRKIKDSSSSSSSSTSCDEEKALLRDKSTDARRATRRRTRTIESDETENFNLRRPGEKKFTTKQLPRCLESTVNGTRYFEVDETEDSRTARKCVRQVEDINELSDVKVSSKARKRDAWNISKSDLLMDPCSCTSEITFEKTEDKDVYSIDMSTISEHTDDSKSVDGAETEQTSTVSESDTEYTEETESSGKIIGEQESRKNTVEHGNIYNDSSEREKLRYLKETSEDTEDEIGTRNTIEEGVKKMINRKRTAEVSKPVNKDAKEMTLGVSERISAAGSVPSLYDPFAGLELYGVHHKSKKKPRKIRTEAKVADTEAEESVIQETQNENSTVVSNKKTATDSQAMRSEIDKTSNLPDKSRSTQTKFHKRDSDKKRKHVKKDIELSAAKVSKKDVIQPNKESKNEEKDSKRRKRRKRRPRKDEQEEFSTNKKKLGRLRRPESQFEDEDTFRRPEKYSDDKYDDYSTERKLNRSVPGFRSILHPDLSETWEPCTSNRCYQYERDKSRLYRRYPIQESSERFYKDSTWHDDNWETVFRPSVQDDRPCQCPRDYETSVSRRSFSEFQDLSRDSRPGTSKARFEMPRVKKYLPMYQTPELIEELKMHDRMRSIREREARGHRTTSSPRSPNSLSASLRRRNEETNRTVVCHPPASSKLAEDDRLPYQETQAYKNVLCEFQRRSGTHDSLRKSRDSIPLIGLSKRADNTKEVEQLYPPRNRRKSHAVKKFATKIITSFKPTSCEKQKCKIRSRKFREDDARGCDYFDPEILSDASHACNCSKKACERSTSASDETTDNN